MIYAEMFGVVPSWLLGSVHWICGLVVLAEALNKLERTAAFAKGLGWRLRTATWLKVVAWMFLAIGAAGALVTPFLHLERPSLRDVSVILGFAILIIRSRVKEQPPCAH
jgi:hypothetical protein